MKELLYYLDVDHEKIIIRSTEKGIQRYDFKLNDWVIDWDMLDIYIGERLVDVISEEEAYRLINKYSKDT